MSAEETLTQYAQDMLIECGWNMADVDERLARQTMRAMADSCGRPGDYVSSLKQSFRVAREAARLVADHDREAARVKTAADIRHRFADFFPKLNEW